uniref:Uncharacterized protein n=1 Tax=Hyaloperonospora arabidopsidis (strain Emoy2) TaxID=559515 RepID=M4BTB2_HYAAE
MKIIYLRAGIVSSLLVHYAERVSGFGEAGVATLRPNIDPSTVKKELRRDDADVNEREERGVSISRLSLMAEELETSPTHPVHLSPEGVDNNPSYIPGAWIEKVEKLRVQLPKYRSGLSDVVYANAAEKRRTELAEWLVNAVDAKSLSKRTGKTLDVFRLHYLEQFVGEANAAFVVFLAKRSPETLATAKLIQDAQFDRYARRRMLPEDLETMWRNEAHSDSSAPDYIDEMVIEYKQYCRDRKMWMRFVQKLSGK